jgi:hypothetical protein
MDKVFDVALQFFREEGWPYLQFEGQPILELNYQGENGRWVCYAQAREEPAQFLFHSICTVNAPEGKRPDIAEFLTRVNYGLSIGNFEMNWEDGEIRYKTGIVVDGDRLSLALITHLVYANVLAMDRYLPGIMRVTYGNVSPAEAIAEIEAQSRVAMID